MRLSAEVGENQEKKSTTLVHITVDPVVWGLYYRNYRGYQISDGFDKDFGKLLESKIGKEAVAYGIQLGQKDREG